MASIRSWLIKKTNFRPAISRTELFANFTEDPLRIGLPSTKMFLYYWLALAQ